PGEPAGPDEATIDMDRTGPAEGDGASGRGMHREGITKRVEPHVKRAARQLERLLWLEDRGKFDHVEAPDIDERPGPFRGSQALGVGERLAHFPKLDQSKGGWKVERELGRLRATARITSHGTTGLALLHHSNYKTR